MMRYREAPRAGSLTFGIPHGSYPKIYSTLIYHLHHSPLDEVIEEISKYDTEEAIERLMCSLRSEEVARSSEYQIVRKQSSQLLSAKINEAGLYLYA